uniref:Alcohol dehydrogenase n=1 Tax=Anopheles dirus TaxID=7168 RepID=A0A182N9C1_9DIPT
MSLRGKHAVLFGGCGGMGLAIGHALLKAGVQKLFILDVTELSEANRSLLKASGSEAQVLCKTCDIANRTELLQVLEGDVMGAFGTLDILVNSAGILDSEDPGKVIGVNLTGVINSCLITLNLMSLAKGGNGGVIVNVASIVGLEPIPIFPTYCASKHGIIGFTRSLGVAPIFDETGVKFLIICPGGTRTPLFQNVKEPSLEVEVVKDMFRGLKEPYVPQSPDVVGDCVVQAIVEGENGATWVCNFGKITIHSFPETNYLTN